MLVGAGWTGGRARFIAGSSSSACCPPGTPALCPGLAFLAFLRSKAARRRIAVSKAARSEYVPALSGTVPARRDMTVPTPPVRPRDACTVLAGITETPSSVKCTLRACDVVSPPSLTRRTGVYAT